MTISRPLIGRGSTSIQSNENLTPKSDSDAADDEVDRSDRDERARYDTIGEDGEVGQRLGDDATFDD